MIGHLHAQMLAKIFDGFAPDGEGFSHDQCEHLHDLAILQLQKPMEDRNKVAAVTVLTQRLAAFIETQQIEHDAATFGERLGRGTGG